jgi:hypothetical protein
MSAQLLYIVRDQVYLYCYSQTEVNQKMDLFLNTICYSIRYGTVEGTGTYLTVLYLQSHGTRMAVVI